MRETKQEKCTGNNQQKGQKRTQQGNRRLKKLMERIDEDEDEDEAR